MRRTFFYFILIMNLAFFGDGEVFAKTSVVASIPPLTYFVERIGGPLVEVKTLIPKGSSPEVYEPTFKQLLALAEAKICVLVGGNLFPAEKKFLHFIEKKKDRIIIDFAMKAGAIKDDPHIWLYFPAVMRLSAEITTALVEKNPEEEAYLKNNFLNLQDDLNKTEDYIKRILRPYRGKAFLVYHPAWGYFARHFGLEQIAVEKEGKSVSAADLSRVIYIAKKRGIKTLFVQKGFDTRSARFIAQEIGANLVETDPLAQDWLTNVRSFAETLKGVLR